MKSKRLAFLAVLAISTLSYGMEVEEESSIIKNASYVIDSESDSFGFSKDNTPGFYTASGELIQEVKERFGGRNEHLRRKLRLDPKAQKPQPTTYKYMYWKGYPYTAFYGLIKGTKGVAGDCIVFFDKNENVIKSYRYNGSTEEIDIFQENTGWKSVSLSDFDELDMTVAENKTLPKDLKDPQPLQNGCQFSIQ